MSRVGKMPIAVPKGVQVKINKDVIEVSGPKGKLSQNLLPGITMEIEKDLVIIKRVSEQKIHKSLHGLTRTLVANMVTGVIDGFTKELEINGVGYRAQLQGRDLVLSLGFSHPINFPLPEGIEVEIDKQTKLTVKGIDKNLVGETAAKIRGLRKPEPYKGKGIKYQNEYIRRKVGKTGA